MKSTRRPIKKKNTAATWWIVGIIAVMVGVALIVLVGMPQAAQQHALVTGNSLGDANAPITVEEYGDFQCPACGQFARQTLPQIESKYVNTGKVRFVFHHDAFIGEESIKAGEAAECAGEQSKFWEYYDTLYANQGGENVGAFSDANLVGFAQQLKLDTAAFTTCLNSGKYRSRVTSDTADASARGVTQTPTLFINGQKVVGALTLQQFELYIGPLLNAVK
jgi:protein-disulfide isomerase